MDSKINEIADKARKIIHKIPFAQQESIDFKTFEYSDPIVTYELHEDGYYQNVNERGRSVQYKVANNQDEMVWYFVNQAIRNYAHRYEGQHRRKFESNLRQVDEITERCYQYIDSTKKFVRDTYDDEIDIYLDLFDAYQKIAQKYRMNHYSDFRKNYKMHRKIINDIDYIADKRYTDSSSGGISNVKESMLSVRQRIAKLSLLDRELDRDFREYDKYVDLLDL